jgi:hypothetical protein
VQILKCHDLRKEAKIRKFYILLKNSERKKVQLKCMYVNSLSPVASGHYHSQLLTVFGYPSEGTPETGTAKYGLSFKHSAI